MSLYVLIEHYRVGRDITYARYFDDSDAARECAERVLDVLGAVKPARCPSRLTVVDCATGEVVFPVRPHRDTEYDPDPFAARQTVTGPPPTNPAGPPGDTLPGVGSPSQSTTPGGAR